MTALTRARPAIEWVVAAPEPVLKQIESRNVSGFVVKLDDSSPFEVLYWYEIKLPALLRSMNCQALFSLTNYLPRRPLFVPTILLEQHAGHFNEEFGSQTLARSSWAGRILWYLKRAWVVSSVIKAKVLIVQTAALADRIARTTRKRRETIRVVPHGLGLVERAAAPSAKARTAQWRIGYVSKWGVQKNFETLFRAVRILHDEGHSIRLVLTLDPNFAPALQTIEAAKSMGLAELIDNRGEVASDGVCDIYDGLDAFVFASTCESFGFPMVEAMARGLPIVVASTAENVEVTGDAGLTFAPYDADALAARLRELMLAPERYRSRQQASLARSDHFSWRQAAEDTALAIEAAVLSGAREPSPAR
jgi:glycosyltransferase involved in cell wall biosynthesis